MSKLNIENISPLLADLRNYKPQFFFPDLIAGLSVAAVQVPTAVAYAQLAGFSPEVGLYSSILPVIIYGIFGSSKHLVVGPDAATCTMVASLVGPLAGGDPVKYIAFSSALSLIAGLLMVIGGFTGMGFIVNFFARPILVGFLNGIALSIIVGQMGKFLGIPLAGGDFIPTLWELLNRLREAHLLTFAVGGVTLVILALLKRFVPKAPTSLIALLVAGCALHFLGQTWGVKLVGEVPSGLPHLGFPELTYHAGQGLFVNALGLVIVSFTSGMLTARSIGARSGDSLDANREMWALGLANISSGFSGGFAITGADSRTAVNAASGNKTQLSSVVAALSTALVAACLAAPLGAIPLTALASVLIFSAVHLVDFSAYGELRRLDRIEFRLSVTTTIGVLALGVLPGVALAITCALIVILLRIYKPDHCQLGLIPGFEGYNDTSLSNEAQTLPGVIIWRFEGPIVFFNSDYFKDCALQTLASSESGAQWFILSLESVTQLDTTGMNSLVELQAELQKKGTRILLARPKPYMMKYRSEKAASAAFPEETVFGTIAAAVEYATSPSKAAD